jgi:hypothetical protein
VKRPLTRALLTQCRAQPRDAVAYLALVEGGVAED